jgi:hypothetical protein
MKNKMAWKSTWAVALSLGALALGQPGCVQAQEKSKIIGPQANGAPMAGALAERAGALASRAAARVVAAADAAQEAGLKNDPASLARMGALPASLIKWGQLRSPWVEGQFMDIQYIGEGKQAKVAVVAPSIPNQLCADSILELAMRPEIERVEVGSWNLEVGEKWKIKDVEGLCQALAKGPVKLWAKRPTLER